MNVDAYRGKRVLVTGALGTIGAGLVRALLPVAADVAGVDLRVPGYGWNAANLEGLAFEAVAGDIGDAELMRPLVRDRDVIFNLAGVGCHRDSIEKPLQDLDNNARAHVGLLELLRRENPRARVVYASTRQVYGRTGGAAIAPVDVNGVSKIAGEYFHAVYADVHGLSTCSLRLTNVYGPRMRIADARQVFIGLWLRSVLEDRGFEVWGGAQVRDLLHVDDAVAAFLAVGLRAPAQVYNVGSGTGASLVEIAQALTRADPRARYIVKPMPEAQARIEIGDYVADVSALTADTGWRAAVSLPDGLAQTLAYFGPRLAAYTDGASRPA